jgi:hypothetical protein
MCCTVAQLIVASWLSISAVKTSTPKLATCLAIHSKLGVTRFSSIVISSRVGITSLVRSHFHLMEVYQLSNILRDGIRLLDRGDRACYD